MQSLEEHHGAMLTLEKPRAFWLREAQTAFCKVLSHSEVVGFDGNAISHRTGTLGPDLRWHLGT